MNFSTVPPKRSSSEREPRVVRREEALHVLGVERLCAGGEADEVGEEDGDDLALLPAGAAADSDLRPAEGAVRERVR